jgi:hypothetical protein
VTVSLAIVVGLVPATCSQPQHIDPLSYRLIVRSDEPAARLQELYRMATTDGAATNALLNGVNPVGRLVVQPIAESAQGSLE